VFITVCNYQCFFKFPQVLLLMLSFIIIILNSTSDVLNVVVNPTSDYVLNFCCVFHPGECPFLKEISKFCLWVFVPVTFRFQSMSSIQVGGVECDE